MRRCRRRLEEIGQLNFRTIDGVHDSSLWCDNFLEIEATGWKGADGTGTAMVCRAEERDYFREKSRLAAACGKALIYSLELDGRPIAMTVNFRSRDGVWAFKTAYRHELARFAPGVLVEVEGTLAAIKDPTIRWVDSCTTNETGLMGELWPDRRPVADLIISTQPMTNGIVAATSTLWRTYLKTKGAALATVARLQDGHVAATLLAFE